MPQIYRKTSLDGKHKTNIIYCGACLDHAWSDKEDDGAPKHFTGRWEEAPLEACDVCGTVDQESRDEYENWAEDMNRQQEEEEEREAVRAFWEENDQIMASQNLQEDK